MTVNELIAEMQGQVDRDPTLGELVVVARDEYGAWVDVDNYCAWDEDGSRIMRYRMSG